MSDIVLTLTPAQAIGLTVSGTALGLTLAGETTGALEFAPATNELTLQLTSDELTLQIAPFFKGDQGIQGDTGPAGPQGVPGAGDLNYTHNQGAASATWTVTHNLGKRPSVTVQDSANDQVDGDVFYNDLNTLTITFSAAFSGVAYLN